MKKVLLVALSVCLCVVLSACSGDSQNTGPENTKAATESVDTSTPQDLEIIESGWIVDESGYVHYGIGVKNPNTGFEATFPTITATGKDAEGKIVFSDEQILMFMLPGAEYYYGGHAGRGVAPETVEFSISVQDRNWIANKNQSVENYTISNINEVDNGYGLTSYTGELTVNKEWDDVSSVMVNTILRDAQGSIVAGYFGFADGAKAEQTYPFEILAYNVPEHSSYEIYAQPW